MNGLSLPNLITIARILLVPLVIWLIIAGNMLPAFVIFIAAGVSDGVDGWIAKRFNLRTKLGAYLDPIADKILLVGIYVTLGFQHELPAWLVILVTSRDLLIVGALLLGNLLDKPMEVRPLMISKVNTAAQIALAGLVLGTQGFGFSDDIIITTVIPAVAALTVLSGAAYLKAWIEHMANGDGRSAGGM